jgi:hypothetical protein
MVDILHWIKNNRQGGTWPRARIASIEAILLSIPTESVHSLDFLEKISMSLAVWVPPQTSPACATRSVERVNPALAFKSRPVP